MPNVERQPNAQIAGAGQPDGKRLRELDPDGQPSQGAPAPPIRRRMKVRTKCLNVYRLGAESFFMTHGIRIRGYMMAATSLPSAPFRSFVSILDLEPTYIFRKFDSFVSQIGRLRLIRATERPSASEGGKTKNVPDPKLI